MTTIDRRMPDPFLHPPAPVPQEGTSVRRMLLLGLGVAVSILLAGNVSTLGFMLPVTLAAGLCALYVLSKLALERFEWFIWVLLLTRPLMDLTKPDADAAASPTSQLATIVGAFVIVAGTIWIAALSYRGERLPLGPVSRALVLLTLTSMISVAVSSEPMISFAQVARTTGAVVVLLVLEQMLRTRRMAMRALLVCGLSAGIPMVVGLIQIPIVVFMPWVGSRITGTFLHPNTFGFFLVMLILLLFPLRRYFSGRARWVVRGVLVLAGLELVMTASRGSWIVLVLGFVVIGFLIKEERRIFWVGPLLLALAVVAFPGIAVRMADLGTEDTVGGRPGNSASWRIDHYETLLHNTNISVFGIGPRMTMNLSEGGLPPHNDALRMLLENGVIGLLCYVLFLVGLLQVGRLALRRLAGGFDRALAVGYIAMIIAFVCNSMGSNVITQFVLLIYLFTIVAVVQTLTALAPPAPAGPRHTTDPHRPSPEGAAAHGDS